VISIDISLTVIPLLVICYDEFKELRILRTGVNKLRKAHNQKLEES